MPPDIQQLYLAYAHDDDAEFVKRLHQDLVERGFHVHTPENLMDKQSTFVLSEIRRIIMDSSQVLLVIGPNARTSPIVRSAWSYAWQYCKAVVPLLRLDANLELPISLQGIDYVDFRHNRRYEFGRDALLSILGTPLAPVGALYNVPPLPKYFIARDEAVDTVKEALFKDNAPVTISAQNVTSASDIGGSGKSVLVASIARDCEIRNAFVDGVFWLTVGEAPNITLLQSQLLQMATGNVMPCTDAEQGKAQIQHVFSGKSALVVLDDVWEAEHFNAFNAMGVRSSLLITTRHPTLADEINALDYAMPLFSDEDAVKLLAMVSGQKPKTMPQTALEIIRACGNRPFALAMIGVLLRNNPTGWGDLLQQLKDSKLIVNNGAKNAEDVLRVIHLALDAVDGEAQTRFLDLAILPPYMRINQQMLLNLWHQANPSLTQGTIKSLFDHMLIQYDEEGRVYLHNLQRQYILHQMNAVHIPHNHLLHAYQLQCRDKGWAYGPNDGYYFENLLFHLREAGRLDELKTLLLDFEWLRAKLSATTINALLADFEMALEATTLRRQTGNLRKPAPSPNEDLRLVRDALQLSAEILAQDKSQLAAQLLGRLLDQDSPAIQKLLAQVQSKQMGTWLSPITSSLKEPKARGRSSLNTSGSIYSQALVLTPDGQKAIIGSRRNTIQVWNLQTGAKEMTLSGHNGMVWSLAVSLDGTRLVSGSDDYSMKLWDLTNGEEIRTLRGHTAPVWAVAIAPDGRTIISGSVDKTIRYWDSDTGLSRKSIIGHTAEITHLTVTPDGRFLISSSYDKTIKLWSLADGGLAKTLKNHEHQVNTVIVSADGKMIVSGSRDKTIRFWSLETGDEIGKIGGHAEPIRTLALTPDGDKLISSSRDRTIRVWDVKKRTELRTLAENQSAVTALAVTPDGLNVVMASLEDPLKVWELKSGNETLSLDVHTQRINALQVVDDEIISASWDGTVKVWNTASGAVTRTYRQHTAAVQTLALTQDGRNAVSGSWDNTVNIWDLANSSLVHTLKAHIEGITATAVSADQKYAVVGSSDNNVTVWDMVTGTRVQNLRGHNNPVTFIAITPDSKCALSGSLDGTLILWDMLNGKMRHTFKGHTEAITTVCILPNGTQAITASRDHTMRLWDFVEGKSIHCFEGHSGWVNALTLTADGKQVISASDDTTLKVWNLDGTGAPLTLCGHHHWVWDVALSEDNQHVFSVSSDQTLKMWALATGENLATFSTDSPLITCLVLPDGQTVAAGSQSGQLHLLRVKGV